MTVSNWHYGNQYLPVLNDQGDDYGMDFGQTRQSMMGYLGQRATPERFQSDEIMRRMGVSALPNSPYSWVMGLGNLGRAQMEDLISRGIIQRGTSGGEADDPYLSLNYAALPQILGMSPEDFVRYDPDMTRVRDPRMVMNDPNYGLVTLGPNVIQPRDTGLAGILPMVAQYAMGQLNPVLSLAWQAMNAASARSNAQVTRDQMSRFANAMQQRQNSDVQGGSQRRSNPLAQMMLLGRLRNQNQGLLGRLTGRRG